MANASPGCNDWCFDRNHGEAVDDACMSIGAFGGCMDGNLYLAEQGDFCYSPSSAIQQGCCCRDLPALNITSPGDYTKTASLTVNAYLMQPSLVRKKLDNGLWETICTLCPKGQLSTTLSGLSEGQHTLYLNATNSDGLSDQKSVTWTADTTPPSLDAMGDTSGGQALDGQTVLIFTKWTDSNLKNASIRIREGNNPQSVAYTMTFSGTSGWLNYTYISAGKGGKTIFWDAAGEDKAGNRFIMSPEKNFTVTVTNTLAISRNWKMAHPGGDIDVDSFVSLCGPNSQVFYFSENDQLMAADRGVLRANSFGKGGGVIFKAQNSGCSSFRYPGGANPVNTFTHNWYVLYTSSQFSIDNLDAKCGQYSQVFYFESDAAKDTLKFRNSGTLTQDKIDAGGGFIVKAQNIPCNI
ncbi:MAG: hypothetical protein HYX24_07105 [Candidatus Aenigmarchaeota archaeon]|nr:hypothetical protein [Candidatus Aenigmarchaeota archaeon]